MPVTPALDFLKSPPTDVPGVVVLFGDEAFLRRRALIELARLVLGDDEDPYGRTNYDGRDARLAPILEDLATRSMFGGTRRLVVVTDADELISEHRAEWETYVAKPKKSGVLVLCVKTWPSNTKLYKAVAASGLSVDCKSPSAAQIPRWLRDWASQVHGKKLSASAAEMMVELVGSEMGILEQELAKLVALAGEDVIDEKLVEDAVGGWRVKTTWDMLDAAAAGKAGEALAQLDRLLSGGETAVGLLAQMSYTLRKFAGAARVLCEAEAEGRALPPLRTALTSVGIKPFVLDKAEPQFRQLGRTRASRLYRWLLETDMDLKGDSPLAPRVILERLIVRMAQPPASRARPAPR
jgi:DNA polymerase-3 subunit delta